MSNPILDDALNFKENPRQLYRLLNRIEQINNCTIAVYEQDDVHTALLMLPDFENDTAREQAAKKLWEDKFFRESLYLYAHNISKFTEWMKECNFINVAKNANNNDNAYSKSYNNKVGMYTVDITMLVIENAEIAYVWTIYLTDYDGNLNVYRTSIESSSRWFNSKLEAYKDAMVIVTKLNEAHLQQEG